MVEELVGYVGCNPLRCVGSFLYVWHALSLTRSRAGLIQIMNGTLNGSGILDSQFHNLRAVQMPPFRFEGFGNTA
jgi:hypothetical protein